MSFNGNLNVTLQCQELTTTQLGIELSRPALAEKLLVNQPIEVAPKRLGQLLSICRQAQSLAATLATSDPQKAEQIIQQQRNALLIENIGQSLWRLSLELPHILMPDNTNENADLLHAYKMLQKHSLLISQKAELTPDDITVFANNAQALFSLLTKVESHSFACMSFDDFTGWLKGNSLLAKAITELPTSGFSSSELMDKFLPAEPTPELCQQLMDLMLTDSNFCQQPTINHQAKATGPVSLLLDNPLIQQLINNKVSMLVTLLAAKLIYSANCIKQLLTIGDSSSEQIAGVFKKNECQFSWVQSARGLLLHACRLTDGQIKQYQICAPTEWNFHPNGVTADFLTKAEFRSNSEIENQARLAMLIADPCIDFTVGVSHA